MLSIIFAELVSLAYKLRPGRLAHNCKMDYSVFICARVSGSVTHIDYFIESAMYGFLFTRCKTSENERVSAANE